MRTAHAKFVRLEPLEGRLLFNAGFDPLFGVGGRSRIDVDNLSDYAGAVHVLPDGKILVAGRATLGITADLASVQRTFVARLNPDGSLDATFGDAGIATAAAPPAVDSVLPVVYPELVRVDSLAVGPDGRIFVGGATAHTATIGQSSTATPGDPDFAVAAFSASGVPDLAFGRRGVAHFPVLAQPQGGEESVDAMVVQPDGSIVATGTIHKWGERVSDVATIRFTAAGVPDVAFGAKFLPLAGESISTASDAAVTLQSDGKIVAMTKATQPRAAAFILGRYNSDGSPDASFGNNGHVVTSVPVPFFAGAEAPGGFCDLLVRPDGSIVAAAKTSYMEATIVRYTAAGVADAGFGGGDGLVELNAGANFANAGALRHNVADNSSTVAVVSVYTPRVQIPNATTDSTSFATTPKPVAGRPRLSVVAVNGFSAYVARLDPAGQVLGESRMNGSGLVGQENVYTVAIQPDGKVLAVGTAYPTVDSGEGVAWEQTADALVVRLDPATFGAPPPPPPPPIVNDPTPTFSGKPSVSRGKFYSFKLIYGTADQARTTGVGVYGPAGLVGEAQLVKVRTARSNKVSIDARPAVASYRAAAPGGKFDAGDNGTYAVRLGTAAAEPLGAVLGEFTVVAKAPTRGSTLERLVVSGDLVGIRAANAETTGWMLRPGDGSPSIELDTRRVGADVTRLTGQTVVVNGIFRTILLRGRGKVRVLAVTSIRAAAP